MNYLKHSLCGCSYKSKELVLHDYATNWSPLKISLTRHIPLKVNLEKKISPQTWQFLCLVWEGPKVLDAQFIDIDEIRVVSDFQIDYQPNVLCNTKYRLRF